MWPQTHLAVLRLPPGVGREPASRPVPAGTHTALRCRGASHSLVEGEDPRCSEASMGTHWALSPGAGSHSPDGIPELRPWGGAASGWACPGVPAADSMADASQTGLLPAQQDPRGDPQHSGHLLRQWGSSPWKGLRELQRAVVKTRPPAQCQRRKGAALGASAPRGSSYSCPEPGEGAWVWGVLSGSRARWG